MSRFTIPDRIAAACAPAYIVLILVGNSIGSGGVVVQSPYQSNTAQTLQSLANQAVRQSANRPATLSINQGTVISIYVAKDVDFGGVVSRL